MVLIGLLIGGAVPFLFSSMLIRAVGRAAFYIVKECRIQFRDKEIWAGTKKPDYGRVVDICTNTAQKELIGPALLAILAPILVGFLLGPYALGGFLAGMILVGQLLAVFMANAGGAWDNAKKMIEDEPTATAGKGSREAQGGRHRRHRGRSAEGHRRPGHQPDGQGDEHGEPARASAWCSSTTSSAPREPDARWIGIVAAVVRRAPSSGRSGRASARTRGRKAWRSRSRATCPDRPGAAREGRPRRTVSGACRPVTGP